MATHIADQGTPAAATQLRHVVEMAGPRHIFLQAGIPGW
jgi:hypothetical protein